MNTPAKFQVVLQAVNPAAYALVDKETRLIRMHEDTKALAIFDSRQAARDARKAHKNTMVVPITMNRARV